MRISTHWSSHGDRLVIDWRERQSCLLEGQSVRCWLCGFGNLPIRDRGRTQLHSTTRHWSGEVQTTMRLDVWRGTARTYECRGMLWNGGGARELGVGL